MKGGIVTFIGISNEAYNWVMNRIIYAWKDEELNYLEVSERILRKHIRELLTAEEFTFEILKLVLYRGYGKYYPEQRFIDVERANSKEEADKIEKEIREYNLAFYTHYREERCDTFQILRWIEKRIGEKFKDKYTESKDDPEIETWQWVMVVPYWRLIFEYKRVMIGKRLKEEKEQKEDNTGKTRLSEQMVIKKADQDHEVVVDKKKAEPIEFVFKKRTKDSESDIQVTEAESNLSKHVDSDMAVNSIVEEKVTEAKVEPIELYNYCNENIIRTEVQVNIKFENRTIPPPTLTKTEQGYELKSHDVVYQNLYLKKDEDDPVIVHPNEYTNVVRKVTREEIMEEECCHGEAMGNLETEKNNPEMLGGDKSLKKFLKNISQERKQSLYIFHKELNENNSSNHLLSR
jgi:hypothetical protein